MFTFPLLSLPFPVYQKQEPDKLHILQTSNVSHLFCSPNPLSSVFPLYFTSWKAKHCVLCVFSYSLHIAYIQFINLFIHLSSLSPWNSSVKWYVAFSGSGSTFWQENLMEACCVHGGLFNFILHHHDLDLTSLHGSFIYKALLRSQCCIFSRLLSTLIFLRQGIPFTDCLGRLPNEFQGSVCLLA